MPDSPHAHPLVDHPRVPAHAAVPQCSYRSASLLALCHWAPASASNNAMMCTPPRKKHAARDPMGIAPAMIPRCVMAAPGRSARRRAAACDGKHDMRSEYGGNTRGLPARHRSPRRADQISHFGQAADAWITTL